MSRGGVVREVLPEKTTNQPQLRPLSNGRETVESFVFVFLFFLVLGLQAEGFVIPTGSMAPTLMGRQKEVTCPQCGEFYAVNADREVSTDLPATLSPRQIVAGICVNCRFPTVIADEPNFQGDRIYVTKLPLSLPFVPSLGEVKLERWDTGVFKLPEDPEVRYIKRVVGMPDEVLRIHRGDLWVKPRDGGEFHRAERPWMHQEAMQIPVYDDTHRPRAIASDPAWTRWVPRPSGAWVEMEAGIFQTQKLAANLALTPAEPAKDAWAELVYRNIVPDPAQWGAILQGQPLPHRPRATLITDFYSYNTDMTSEAGTDPNAAEKTWRQPHWVGDLTLRFSLEVVQPSGKFRIDLVKAGVINRCEIDLSSGEATLWHGETRVAGPKPSGIAKAGTYAVDFANVDDRLTLAVDGGLPFGEGVPFQESSAIAPTAEDLQPARIGAQDAGVIVRSLRITRDVYYSIEPAHADLDLIQLNEPLPRHPVTFFDWLANPKNFEGFGKIPPRDFPIRPGHYMMLGDNSPWSRDGRAWLRTDQQDPDVPGSGWDSSGREAWEVPENLLIGKAFCVYWPHLKPFGPTIRLGANIRLPARPNLEKIRWVR